MTAAAHPKSVRRLLNRLASISCVLALAQGAIAQCVGWQATPEARRQCCQNGVCPLHHRESTSQTHVSQAAADDCCAQSEQRGSTPTRTVLAGVTTLAVIQSVQAVELGLAPTIIVSAPAESPSPPTRVPKHVLLSVFLV